MTRRALTAILAVAALVATASPAQAAAPNTTITSGPKGLIASRTAKFGFKASVSGATFHCKLDKKAWAPCASPKKYTKLAQGKHTFSVRAGKAGSVDRTPATRSFKVDTVKPQTTITSGPSGQIPDPTPTFVFSSSEPGAFQCRVLTSQAFKTCTSPFTPSLTTDGPYTFQVRARDRAGNLDATPATRSFTLERVLTADQAGAETLVAAYFPDELVMDVVPNCGPPPPEVEGATLDCYAGTPIPASDQLLISSDQFVAPVLPGSYAVTVASEVATLEPVLVTWLGLNCAVSFASAYGDNPKWTITMDLTFDTHPGTGQPRATFSDIAVTGVEPTDHGLGAWPPFAQWCGQQPGPFDSDFIAGIYGWILDTYAGSIGNPACAVTGPEHFGECPA